MKTLQNFLQNLSYKEDKVISNHAKGLLKALKASAESHKLKFYVITDDDLGKGISDEKILQQLGYKKAV
ncbi:MAG TPA: hypothetical protein VNX68_16535 [Nitrosopumilaceae archaeon]|jgi:hypothetical protein|nr:hypothetical protein [Nitrosopumilaceae archaeon]